MKNGWHDTDKLKPKANQVIVGIWAYITETFAELCYYDKDTREWFSAQPGSQNNAIEAPDYWIDMPYD